jgi:hypothetical protein
MIFYKQKHAAPPTGLTPLNIHNHIRVDSILMAMRRYHFANKRIPEEWALELQDLITKIGE